MARRSKRGAPSRSREAQRADAWRDDDDAREGSGARFRRREQAARAPLWWSSEEFTSWLASKSLAFALKSSHDATSSGSRWHSPEELTSHDGVLFSHDVVETLDQTVSGTRCRGRASAGGLPTSRRSARTHDWRESSRCRRASSSLRRTCSRHSYIERWLRLVAVSPLCSRRAGCPMASSDRRRVSGQLAGLDHEVILRAALVPRPIHVSGWDMAKGSQADLAHGAPGAVYFFERADGTPSARLTPRRSGSARSAHAPTRASAASSPASGAPQGTTHEHETFLLHALSPLHAGTGHTPEHHRPANARMKARFPFLRLLD